MGNNRRSVGFTIDRIPQGNDHVEVLETTCAGSCSRPYRIDEPHPSYGEVRAALERGDRSVISCYHKIVLADLPLSSPASS